MGALVGGCGGCAGDDGFRPATGDLAASTRAVDFGAATLGLRTERSVSLAQRGLLPAEISSIRVVPDGAPFSFDTPPPNEVGRDREASVELVYRPLTAGAHDATLVVELEYGETVEIALSGRGVDARAEPLDDIDFGRPAIGATRKRTLRLRNAHETAVPFGLRFEGADASEFRTWREWSLPPHSEVEVELGYRPVARAGARDVALNLDACPLCAETALPVRADAVLEPLEVTPDPVLFSRVTIDADQTIDVRITNATDEPIRLDPLTLAESSAAGFMLDAAPAPIVLGELESTGARVRFSPTLLGRAVGTLLIRSDAEPRGAVDVPIRAFGGGAELVVVPGKLSFKPIPVRARRTLDAVLSNGGADPNASPLHVTGVRVRGEGFSITNAPAPAFTLAAGARVPVTVAFAPTRHGLHTGTLVIESDDPLVPSLDVPLVGEGIDAANCRLSPQPEALDFGLVHAGKGAALGVAIENTGTEVCTLWGQAVEGDEAFSLSRDRGTVVLQPGEAVYMPVAFEPRAERSYGATLVLETNRAEGRLEVPLSAGAHPSCLVPDPAYVEFGSGRLDCGPRERRAGWRNVCSVPVDIDDVYLGEGADMQSFSLAQVPSTPRTLAPGERLSLTVHWTPTAAGYTTRPLFAQTTDAPRPVLVPLSVDAELSAFHEERRIQPTPAKVDMLWVIDNTASMKDERDSLARSIGSFLSRADALGVDYHIGVTTTGVGAPTSFNGETCPGGVNGGESGRLFPVDHSRPRVVHPALADRADILGANIDVGGCHSVEQGLHAAQLALSPPLIDNADDHRTPEPNDGNLGLLRSDAQLAVVVVSDEDDESPESVARHARALRATKTTSPFTFAAIVAPEQGCPSAVQPGLRYLEAVRLLGGLAGDVCASDWSATLQTLAERLFQPVVRWVLDAPADTRTLRVSVDGRTATGWRYDDADHAIVFDEAPEPGSELVFEYNEPCP